MATNMYLKFENPEIPGECTAPGHTGEIEILSWSHGFMQPTSPTRSGTVEQASHQNFSLTKYIDAATSTLLKYCWAGKQIGKATLKCYRADGPYASNPVEYLSVVMEHVIIANYSVSGGPGDIPVETIALDYGIIQYNYMGQKHADGMAADGRSTRHDLKKMMVE